MKPKPKTSAAAAELRRLAETRLRVRRPRTASAAGTPKSAADSQRLLHELQVHQVELELQNTELQAARDRMEALVEKYTDLYDFAPVGYLSIDEWGAILEANLTSAGLLGVERSRLINRPLLLFMSPASRPVFLAFLARVWTEPTNQVCDVQLLKQGATFWASFRGTSAVFLKGAPKWCRVAVSDITVRKQAEDLLRQNETLFSTLIEQAPVGVVVVDGQLRLLQVNPKAQPAFRNLHPLIGREIGEINRLQWPKKIAEENLRHYRETLKTGKPYHALDLSARRTDTGLTETYEWQLQRITLPSGAYGVVCFFNDVTERRRAEAAQRRNDLLAASNRKQAQEITRRQAVEAALQQSHKHQAQLLEQSRQMHEQMRHLSHQILRAQEEERKRISRELHDEITQTLVGINVQLAGLAGAAAVNPAVLKQKIACTQRLVEKSVNIVHQFARELRPTALDDLGLIATLHSFLEEFTKRTGLRVHFTTYASDRMDELDNAMRTVFYRVAQEALANVARHAQATRVELDLRKLPGALLLQIKDNGKSFEVERVLHAKKYKRLGILGMRERVEMVGGDFSIKSTPGQGTTIRAQIPFANGAARGGGRWNPLRPHLERR